MSASVPSKQVGLALHAWLTRLNTRTTWDLKAYVYIELSLQSFSIDLFNLDISGDSYLASNFSYLETKFFGP